MGHDEESGLGAYRFMLVIFMTLYLWVPVGLCAALLSLLMGRSLLEGLGVGLLLSGLIMFLGSLDEEVREDWLEGTRDDLDPRNEPPRPPRPKDGYYGW